MAAVINNNDSLEDINIDIKNLKISTLNVRGLKNNLKQNAILQTIKDLNSDIIALQETHLCKTEFTQIESLWDGPCLFSESAGNSMGLCILFKNFFKNHEIDILISNDRLLLCSLKLGNEFFYVGNIYAPSTDKYTKINFFDKTKRLLKENLNDNQIRRLILLGDFNCVCDNNKDIITGHPHSKDVVLNFNQMLNELDFDDLWRKDNLFKKEHTWSGGRPLIMRRIDYIFSSKFLTPYVSSCYIHSVGHTDHRFVTCIMEFSKFKRGKGIYKMNNKLLENPCFKKTLHKLLMDNKEEYNDTDPSLKWTIIKNKSKELAQQFGKYNKIKREEERDQMRKSLDYHEKLLADDGTNMELQNKILILKNSLEINNIETAEAAKLRAKVKWIKEGEKCKDFFLGLEKHRASSNTVYKVKNSDGILVTDENEIVETFANFFKNVYSSSIEKDKVDSNLDNFLKNVNLKQLNAEEKIFIDRPISLEELKSAFKGLNKTSSPGIDGLTMEFYETYFEVIQDLLLEYYNFCFNQSALTESVQIGLISLIHKGKSLSRDEVSNWRPITLSNIDYKIIAKLLANRIKIVMDKIVGKQQQGFIKGRHIANLIRGIDDILEYERNKNINDLLFIIDFKQAFDKIDTYYISQVFKKFGFGEIFIQWLNTIFANRTSCVKNGGYLSSFFEIKCGVKQGCPIAPLLFILAAEILAQNIIQDKRIEGVTLPYSLDQIKIVQFADDTSFFCKSFIDIREILSRLKSFGSFTGLFINIKKCAIMCMGREINNIEKIEGIVCKNQVKIVGIVFDKYKNAGEIKENWENRIKKIKRIVKQWMKRNLSVIGKIQVIKTFLLSQFVYVLQSILLKKEILDEINTILFRFIWKRDSIDKKAWERIKRNVLCNPKDKGGLDMIDLHAFQNSFLTEWACKLLDKEEDYWKRFAFSFYERMGGEAVFKSNVTLKKIKGLETITSPFWRAVLKTWIENNTIKQEIKRNDTICNNENITINNNVLFIEKAIKVGIIYIKDAFINGQLISFKQYEERVGKDPTNIIDYVAIKANISKVNTLITYEVSKKYYFKEYDIETII